MTGIDDGERAHTPADADFVQNLAALDQDLDELESLAAAALSDERIDPDVTARLLNAPTGLTYDELTAYNRQHRAIDDPADVDISELLDSAALHQLDEWRKAQRLPWETSDFVVVGVAALIGALASLYDTRVDTTVLKGLGWLKKSELLRQWENDAKRLPIDYTGPKFGGPAHRVLSPGHDIGRFFTALNQVRSGTFQGTWWQDGQRIVEQVTTTRSGMPFAQASEPHLALALLLKHWAADFVTKMSLPLPGWTLFRDMPDRDLRKFAYDAYAGSNTGDGLNLRSGALTPALGMFATEVMIRTHTHLAAYRETGSPRLDTAGAAKRTEMLLAAHAAAGAVSLSKTVAVALAGETALAARHLNVPVLVQVGILALTVRSDANTRAEADVASWEHLLENEAATWTLPEAVRIAELLAATGIGNADDDRLIE